MAPTYTWKYYFNVVLKVNKKRNIILQWTQAKKKGNTWLSFYEIIVYYGN